MKSFIKKIINPLTLIAREMKLVEWISFKKTTNYTLLVLVISFFVGIIIVVFDVVLFKGRDIILTL
jgi:preprotein translocase SecE subunit